MFLELFLVQGSGFVKCLFFGSGSLVIAWIMHALPVMYRVLYNQSNDSHLAVIAVFTKKSANFPARAREDAKKIAYFHRRKEIVSYKEKLYENIFFKLGIRREGRFSLKKSVIGTILHLRKILKLHILHKLHGRNIGR